MPVNAGTVYINVVPNTAAFATQLKSQVTPAAAAAGSSISRSFQKAGSGLTKLGRSLTRNVSLPLVGIGAGATKMAYDYDKAFTQIAATTNVGTKTIEGWRKEVLQLSGQTAQAPVELADALYFLASAGLKSGQVMDVLTASAKASAAGLGETQEIARLTANVLNAYPKAGLKATDAIDTLVNAVKVGSAAPDEFADAMGRILPIASKAGVGFDQIAASLASVSNIGLDVNEGVTAMRGLLQALVAPGTQAADTLKEIGISTDELRASLAEDGLIATLDLLEESSKGQIDVLQDIIPNVRALTGFFGLQGQEARKVDAAFRQVANSTGELNKAFRTTQKSDAFKFDKALNDLRVAAVKLGNQIIPILVDTVIPAVQDAVKWFSELSPEAKKLGVQLAGLAIVAGPLLRFAGALTKVGGAIAGLIRGAAGGAGLAAAADTFRSLGKEGFTLGQRFDLLYPTLTRLAGPLAALVVTVHDLHAAFRAFQQGGILAGIEAELSGWAATMISGMRVWKPAVSDVESFEEAVRQVGAAVADGSMSFEEGQQAIREYAREFNIGISALEVRRVLNRAGGQVGALTAEFRRLTGHGLKPATQALLANAIAEGRVGAAIRILKNLVRGAEKDVRKHGKATQDAAKDAADADRAQRHLAGSTRDAGAAADDSAAKMRAYAGDIRSIPKNWQTKVTAETSEALARINAYKSAITSIPQNWQTLVTTAIDRQGGEHGAFIPGAQHGGHVRREQLIRVGEKSKPEMILPLKDPAGAAALQTAMEGALRAVLSRGGGGADKAYLQIDGFHRAGLRLDQDRDWSYAQWGW